MMLGKLGVSSGVNTVLGRAKKRLDQRQREANGTEWVKLRIARNDMGIAHVINDLSIPPISAWEARTLLLSYTRSLSRILRWTRSQVNPQWALVNRAEKWRQLS